MEECHLPWECENEWPYESMFSSSLVPSGTLHTCCVGGSQIAVRVEDPPLFITWDGLVLLLPSWMRFCNGSRLSSTLRDFFGQGGRSKARWMLFLSVESVGGKVVANPE
jgi:hypothetical protein